MTLANPHVTTASDWFNASLVLLFAYGGFEGALVPMSEARDPQRDVPFAMLIAFLSVTLIYVLVQIVVIRVLPDPAQTDRPLAMAAEVFLGPAGAAFIAVSALLALFGYLSANMVHVPRTTFALAEHGDLPPMFADQVRRGLRDAERSGRILLSSGAALDHPVHPGLPETAYLKALTLQLD